MTRIKNLRLWFLENYYPLFDLFRTISSNPWISKLCPQCQRQISNENWGGCRASRREITHSINAPSWLLVANANSLFCHDAWIFEVSRAVLNDTLYTRKWWIESSTLLKCWGLIWRGNSYVLYCYCPSYTIVPQIILDWHLSSLCPS